MWCPQLMWCPQTGDIGPHPHRVLSTQGSSGLYLPPGLSCWSSVCLQPRRPAVPRWQQYSQPLACTECAQSQPLG